MIHPCGSFELGKEEMVKSSHSEQRFDYIFGFGSIINTDTHAPWLTGTSSDEDNEDCTILKGQRATILASFGYSRGRFIV